MTSSLKTVFTAIVFLPLMMNAQQDSKESHWPYPFTLQTVHAVCVDTTYTLLGGSRASKPKKKIDSFIYEVHFSLNFSGNPNGWTKPFYLSVQEANLDTTILTFNAAQEALGIHNNPPFSFSWKTKKQGILQMVLGYSVEDAPLQFDASNPFLSKRISLAENR